MPQAKPVARNDLAKIYDRCFFAEYGSANPVYARCCATIAEEIVRRFQPRSAVDWGCGAGLHVAALQKLGVAAIGIDGVDWPADLRAPNVEIRRADLRDPICVGLAPPAYDLSLCLDVLEHLPEADAARATETITRGAQLLVLSCAPPGQGGHHHVNEQPRRYWIARLAAIGWSYSRRETGALESAFLIRRETLPLSWMYHNLCVYRPTHGRRLHLLGQGTAGRRSSHCEIGYSNHTEATSCAKYESLLHLLATYSEREDQRKALSGQSRGRRL